MSQLKPVRGTHDLFGETLDKYQFIEEAAKKVCSLFQFHEIQTPIFESTSVFTKSIGDQTDIVSKEMYEFKDKGGDSITLRPEGTAGVVRAFLSNGLTQHLPLKLFYMGPMFRYERPQKGRQRQFHQMGIELLGVQSIQADLEVLSLSYLFLKEAGLVDKTQLEINSIGDEESRNQFKSKLIDYLTPFKSDLSEESQKRLKKNPLRILDSKNPTDQEIIQNGPQMNHCLNDSSKETFDSILKGLTEFNIPYKLNHQLVRGLDYYDNLVFEWTTNQLGAQNAVLAGGRYNKLVESMGGSSTPGVGWGAGMDRLALLASPTVSSLRPIGLIPLGEEAQTFCSTLSHELRSKGYSTFLSYSGNMGKRMKKANKMNSRIALIVGEEELQQSTLQMKDFDSGEQKSISYKSLDDELKNFSECKGENWQRFSL